MKLYCYVFCDDNCQIRDTYIIMIIVATPKHFWNIDPLFLLIMKTCVNCLFGFPELVFCTKELNANKDFGRSIYRNYDLCNFSIIKRYWAFVFSEKKTFVGKLKKRAN